MALNLAFWMVLTPWFPPVAAQHEMPAQEEEEIWESPAGVLHRRGATVTATIWNPRKSGQVLLVAPEGFRPLYNVDYREEYLYRVSQGGRRWERAHVTEFFSVYTDGSVRDNGGRIDWDYDGAEGTPTVTLDWITATEEASGEFDNLQDHHEGAYMVAKGGTFVRVAMSVQRSPLQQYAREEPEVLFTVPAGFRPWHPVQRFITGWQVDARGYPFAPARAVDFEVVVWPSGEVYYRDSDTLPDVAYVGYQFHTAWETAESPDRAILHDIHRAIAQTTMEARALYNWLRPDVPLAEWYGVATDQWGRVTHLDLSRLSLRGGFPEALGHLTYLKVLRLGTDSGMGGRGQYASLPASVSDLRNLEVLDLTGLPLQGPLPAAWGQLEKLRTLNLKWTDYTGPLPPAWSALKNLEYLELTGVAVSGPLPPAWNQMENLQTLLLTGTELTGPLPDTWCLMPRLRVLDIRGAAMHGGLPASWGHLAELKYVHLWDTGITGGLPPEWRHIPDLQLVVIDGDEDLLWDLLQQYPQPPAAPSEVKCAPPYLPCTEDTFALTPFCEWVRKLQ